MAKLPEPLPNTWKVAAEWLTAVLGITWDPRHAEIVANGIQAAQDPDSEGVFVQITFAGTVEVSAYEQFVELLYRGTALSPQDRL